jgi:hypothetical protein
MSDFFEAPQYHWARLIFERSLCGIYFLAFLSAFNQFTALLGERGLLPARDFLSLTSFSHSPSLFHWRYSDVLLKGVCLVGMFISLMFCFGVLGKAPVIIHFASWLCLYFLYLSIVNIGQDFYSFGWETMLLEAGFFAAFMGPETVVPSWIPIIILRWMLFRTEMGAGLIKLRGDTCWRDFTCLYYHHETQPLPNPLSRFFHHAPKKIHRFGVRFSHFCQLVAPFGLFLPQPISSLAGAFLIVHQLALIISGNYSWLNWLTIVLATLAFHQTEALSYAAAPLWFTGVQLLALAGAIMLSYRPLLNLFSPNQYMNYCWNRWHLVGAYGAFGSVTKKRYEVVIEGTDSDDIMDESSWKEYTFKGKPTKLNTMPPVVAPYHLRLDWMIWFLPFTVQVSNRKLYVGGHRRYFINLIIKFLHDDQNILKLMGHNPFPLGPPKYIRARFYHYQFTTKEEKKLSGNVWKREFIGEFLPPVSLNG